MTFFYRTGKAPIYLDQTTILYKYIVARIFENSSPLNTWQALKYKRLREIGKPTTSHPQSQVVLNYGLQGCIRTSNDLMSEEIDGLFAASLSQSLDMCTFKGISSARGMWSGEKVGMTAAKYIKGSSTPKLNQMQVQNAFHRSTRHLNRKTGRTYWELMTKFQDIMFKPEISLRKTKDTLEQSLKNLVTFRKNELPLLYAADPHEVIKAHELENMVLVAELFLKSSLLRTESRYSHRRPDYTSPDNKNWLKFINWQKLGNGKQKMSFEPVSS